VKAVIKDPGSGEPLLSPIRTSLENSLEVPLAPVRVHTDQRASAAVGALGARAFTYGTHVFLGSRERPTDLALMAHEVTHVVQQQGRPVLLLSDDRGANNGFEREAQQAATAVQRGNHATIRKRTGSPQVQGIWPIDEAAQWIENQAWGLVNQYAPELAPIIRQGPVEWLKEKIAAAVETLFNTLMGPVRAVTGVAAMLMAHFTNLLGWLRDAAARIARGDCGPLTEAAEKIQQVFEGLAAPVIERIKQLADRVKGFFSGLWERFGAPVWQFLQRIGGAAWERIQQLGRWIWEKTAPIRRILNRAWTWIKNKIGIGEGPEGQDGILQWVQRKAQAVWDQHLKPFYERYRRPILIVAGVLVMLSPAGPLIAIGAAIGGLAVGIRWIRQNLRNRQAIVQQRGYLQGVIIPGIMGAVNRVSAFVLEKAQFIAGKLADVVSGLNQALGAVAGTILNFVVGLLQWIIDRFQELVRWATGQLLAFAEWIRSALERLRIFLAPVLNFLGRVAAAVANVMRLTYELGGRIWNAIPACLRDPFIDFFIPLILRQISFFQELVSTPEAWQQTRAQVMGLIRQIFRDFDLMGAIRSAFRIVVRALRIPIDLVGQLLDKAARAWDAVVAAPLRFIESALKAILVGIGKFMRNILSHLWFGVQGWLLNSLQGTGVSPPSSWDLRGLFGFVLDVLGISIDHVIDLIDRRVPGAGRQLRRAMRILTGAWEWLKVALTEGPRGLWRMVVDRLGNLGNLVLQSAVSWVMTRIIAIVSARLTALAASAGLSSILEAVVAVYQAVRTAIEYARRILEVLIRVFDTVLQIAQGVIEPAATMVESGLRLVMPVVIGFLANYAGLGGIGNRIREIIGQVRERVDNAILGLIDRGMAALQGLLNLIRRGVAAVVAWWAGIRERFTDEQNQEHSLYIEDGPAGAARLIIASNPEEISRFLTRREGELNAIPGTSTEKTSRLQAVDRARGVIQNINNLVNTVAATASPPADTRPYEQRLRGLMVDLRNHVRAVGYSGDPPVQSFTVTPAFSGSKATGIRMEAFMRGASPAGEPARVYAGTLQGALPMLTGWGIRNRWVAYHLLNEGLGGRAVESNLIPAHQEDNGHYSDNFETNVRALAGVGSGGGTPRPVWMDVTVTPADGRFYQSIAAEGGPMEPTRDRWVPVTRGREVYRYSHSFQRPERNRIAINALRVLTPQQRAEILADAAVDNTTVTYILGTTTNRITSVANIVYLINSNASWTAGDKTRRINQVERAVWSFDD
jgi:phage-related protein